MNIVLMKPTPSSFWNKSFGKHQEFIQRTVNNWELVLSVSNGDYEQEYVEFFEFPVKPTKRQIRQTKRKFRKIYLEDSLK
ncbi:hypothetical protein VR5_036 [Escherichia phage vb_EcoM-VR5]|uniref:Uncharacterized protein n=1 Tax=Escherichia phage vb_EcoM-VR5 TaxID=1567026 RepID=A0A0A7HB43_9CAUD|nr:hypothetical protein AVV69_gp036 [Escherichia phage vb_EcoM-VR5]AIZ01823.1 hypothetical protein VR5_036 [Escherichia phage vb_EcoM-VR5]